MKSLKRIAAMLLTFVMMLMIVPADTAKAASNQFPTKFRVYFGSNESTKEIRVSDHHTYLKNVKSKDSNLIAGLTDYRYTSYGSGIDTYTLAFYAKKQGTYDITYDVMKDSKKVKTVKAKVYAYPCPISVTLDGKYENYYGNKTTGKLKVTSQKGNPIQKIEVGTYKTSKEKLDEEWLKSERIYSELKYRTAKNNSKIQLGTTGYYHKENVDNIQNNIINELFQSDLMSETQIRVTYKDKYTKQNEQLDRWRFYGLAK